MGSWRKTWIKGQWCSWAQNWIYASGTISYLIQYRKKINDLIFYIGIATQKQS